MKAILTLISVTLISCALPKTQGANPLDFPGSAEPTVTELHAKNVRLITGNPVHPN